MIKHFDKIRNKYKSFNQEAKNRLDSFLIDISKNPKNFKIFRIKRIIKKYIKSTLKKIQAARSLSYPFSYVNVDEIPNISDKLKKDLSKFKLVGDNWLEEKEKKPIAILLGMNYWKRGFISDYLPEYRTAFGPAKLSLGFKLVRQLLNSSINPSAFFVWGYKDIALVRWYAKLKRIPIIRVEDGFVRSADLGVSKSTPCSLVFDRKGLHYNCNTPSDIEELLNNYNFDLDQNIIKDAEETLEMMLMLNISKYNLPSLTENFIVPINFKKNVLVIGQVHEDKSLKLGNPNAWNMQDLLALASVENPDANIFYRPHPEVYAKYKQDKLDDSITLTDPNIPLSAVLEKIDHVYTISSLSGFEAILRDIKVTVIGVPFYAGWGLTDDRVKLSRRNRKLTKIQLFAIAYLKYPKYLSDLENSVIGLKSSCLFINADREILCQDKISKKNMKSINDVKFLATSKYWPKLFNNSAIDSNPNLISQSLKYIDFAEVFKNTSGVYAQIAILCYIFSKIDINNICGILQVIREYLHKEVLDIILRELWECYKRPELLTHYSWYLNKLENGSILAQNLLKEVNTLNKEKNIKFDQKVLNEMYSAASTYVTEKDFDKALCELCKTCIRGTANLNIMHLFIQISNLKFDFTSSVEIARFCNLIDIFFANGKASYIITRDLIFSEQFSRQELISTAIVAYLLNPSRLFELNYIIENQDKNIALLLPAILNITNSINLEKIVAYLEVGNLEKAVKICKALISSNKFNSTILREKNIHIGSIITLSMIYRTQGKLDLAYNTIITIKDSNSVGYYHEVLRLLTCLNRVVEAKNILDEALSKQFKNNFLRPLSEAVQVQVLFAAKEIEEAFKAYSDMNFNKNLNYYFGDKYKVFDDIEKKSTIKNFLLLACYGPGDEIRFASIYKDLTEHFGSKNLKISCDYRLLKLFQRSFKKINFIPVKRTRLYNINDYPIELYKNLPASDLNSILDNNALEEINKSSTFALVSDLIWHFRKCYSDFPGTPFLKANNKKIISYKNKLNNKRKVAKLIGISWRSSLQTYSRKEHYLTIQELEPIFQIDGLQFVNFQYDDCNEELEWVEKRYPNKIINFDEIDQYNDFDSVAALMKCMDLIIAPCTTVIELAGALGCKAWMFSNSPLPEISWRKNKKKIDVWQNTITHIEGETLGDRSSLISELTKKLKEYSLM